MSAAHLPDDDSLAARLATVRQQIARACDRVGRPASSVVIVAVGKTHDPETIQRLVDLGIRDIGENRVSELLAKQDRVEGASWHMVGRVQRRKVRDLVGQRVLVHSVDRPELADAFSRRAATAGVLQRVLVQVNVGDDPAKGGVASDEALDLVAYARSRPHLSVEGLMTIPPLAPEHADTGEAVRPLFAELRRLRDRARQQWPEVIHLSMGMTDDLEAAVEEGATMVRVGRALFGPRHEGPWRPAGGNA